MSYYVRSLGVSVLLPMLLWQSPMEPLPGGPQTPLTAVVTRLTGTVTAETPDGDTIRLHPGQVIPQACTVSVPEGGTVSLVCSNDRWLHLDGGAGLRLSATSCATGRSLTPGTYAALSPGERTLTRDLAAEEVVRRVRTARAAVLKIRTRGGEEDDPRIPVLLEPRDSGTLDPRPVLRWTHVPRSREIVLRVVGAAPWTATLSASEVHCERRSYPPGSLEVCSSPWPQDAPDLPTGGLSYVSVGVKTTIGGSFTWGDRHRVWRVPDEPARAIRTSLELLEQVEAPPAGTSLRVPVFLADQGLLDAAEEALRRELIAHPSATGLLLKGALDLERGLALSAARDFREVIRSAPSDEIAEAADSGLRTALALTEPDN